MNDTPLRTRLPDVNDPLLVAISVIGYGGKLFMPPYGVCKQVQIQGKATQEAISFTFETGYLPQSQLEGFKRLEEYGFTVVKPTSSWYGTNVLHWQSEVIRQAVEKVEGSLMSNDKIRASGYDEELAMKVLDVLGLAFPHALTMIDIKSKLAPEPSDAQLLDALEGLLVEQLIEGEGLRDSMNKLVDVGAARITRDGRNFLVNGNPSPSSAVVHGDQIINYGHAAAMGRHAVGTINFQQQWDDVSSSASYSALVSDLERLRIELYKRASSRDEHKVLAVIADAEEKAEQHDGPKMMEILSKVGIGALKVAKDIGVDLAAKIIAKASGLEP